LDRVFAYEAKAGKKIAPIDWEDVQGPSDGIYYKLGLDWGASEDALDVGVGY
jgi:hypothetical protein